jgi:hypothetical protein
LVHVEVPLHAYVVHAVSIGQVTVAPTHVPEPSQWSPELHGLPSLQPVAALG